MGREGERGDVGSHACVVAKMISQKQSRAGITRRWGERGGAGGRETGGNTGSGKLWGSAAHRGPTRYQNNILHKEWQGNSLKPPNTMEPSMLEREGSPP